MHVYKLLRNCILKIVSLMLVKKKILLLPKEKYIYQSLRFITCSYINCKHSNISNTGQNATSTYQIKNMCFK